ncbi:hypothetical protein LTR62_004763 [Meristemomyces frigidus]|uniref:Rad4-domain-containing protein n=1 Tax=Meristemomyces frigidus TaxID=1508187 RepID=A0AAN7YNX0_9PEZI|nr:hypothetical protein LTR62_004763 [Meristemomyces frigidus]
MPPHVSRKRSRSPLTAHTPRSNDKPATRPTKVSLFDTIDAPAKRRKTVEENKQLLAELNADDDESDGILSEADSDDFEDVPVAKRRKTEAISGDDEVEDESDDDGMDWEDVAQQSVQPIAGPSTLPELADVSFTLKDDGEMMDEGLTVPGAKKGPSKKEKMVRYLSHCVHVQALLWHNTIRNGWLNDKQVQKTLVEGLTEGVKREVTRWREAMGTLSKEELQAKKQAAAAKSKGKKGRKGRDKGNGRDWNYDAEHAEQGVPNLSAGDPLLRLLKVLTAYWRKRFTITAPGLRKQGYMSVKRARDEIKHWQHNKQDAEEHGERIESIQQLRQCAKVCEGSRDVGAQLFVALLRGLSLDTRMVVNLQPLGLGFGKAEDINTKKAKVKIALDEVVDDSDVVEVVSKKAKLGKTVAKKEKPARTSGRGQKNQPISLDDSDSPLSDVPNDADDDDASIVDTTPISPKKKPNKKYDRDLAFPTYWVEVVSPATHRCIPVDPIVLSTIATNDDLLQTFEPRGKKAEVGKQVMAYTVAFLSDGSAKDVTIRYLRKHQLPGKTKGMRLTAEKRPVYNRRGKVKRYEEYDWFRTVMSHYDRPETKRTAADDLEDQTDLKPQNPERAEKEVEKESLQWYKQSADFVLEQHLRREEALIPSAESVKTFTAGKGDKAKDFPVFRRADVVACKTVESWHKEGRSLREGQHPLKLVTMRAVTLIRKREMEDALRETGEKLKQGLYSREQTDWIIPAPIVDGVIPKNAFGNMDVYVPTMVPAGAVHVPLKGTAKLCRKLDIDYAEACTGFEFGKQRAVPVLTGVVVAGEHEILVRDAWKVEQAEVKRKEDTKRTAVALQWWRRMVLGLRVLDRMKRDYADGGGKGEVANPFVAKAGREGRGAVLPAAVAGDEGDDLGGGFFLPGHEEEEVPQTRQELARGGTEDLAGVGGVMLEDENQTVSDVDDGDGGGGFLMEESEDQTAETSTEKSLAPVTAVSLSSLREAHDLETDLDEDGDEVGVTDIQDKAQGKKSTDKKKKEKQTTSATTKPSKKNATSSPRIVLSRGDHTPVKPPSRTTRKKSTPLKSQYFVDGDEDGDEEEDEDGDEEEGTARDDEEEEEESSEEEVVRPRGTTTRTRTRATRGGG